MTTPPPTEWVRFQVPFEYPVYFSEAVFAETNPTLVEALSRLEPTRRHRVFVIVDGGLDAAVPNFAARIRGYFDAHAARLELAGDPLVIAGGEACKNDPRLIPSLLQRFAELKLDRQSFCLIIGGGAVLDAAGFAAATAHRGIRVVRVPSTVLGQNDAGIGVKNGVNAFGAKNFIGSFAPPFAVVNDLTLLDSLPRRDRIAGIAEAVKVALIRDAPFFDWLCEHGAELSRFESAATGAMIRRAAALHLQQISGGGDPFEAGSARPLDFGHWAAHKLEGLSGYQLRHGEAVAIGIALDSRYSFEVGLLPEAHLERIVALLILLGFRLFHPALEALDADGELSVLNGLQEFREHLGGELSITLLTDIGRGVDVHEMSTPVVRRSLAWLGARFRQ
jgi:3-dehydroquinate synthase